MLTRRTWLIGASTASAALFSRRLRAEAPPLEVRVPGNAVAAIAGAIGGKDVKVVVDTGLSGPQVRIGDGDPIGVSDRLLLKGVGSARALFLDDARNAPKLGVNLREAMSKAAPKLAKRLQENHRAWSMPFARKVVRWQAELAKSTVHGKTIRDEHGRIYLLEWAGAKIDSAAKSSGPTSLANLPRAPDAPTLAAYEAYVRRLIAAVTR
jgi:hypothetical protein